MLEEFIDEPQASANHRVLGMNYEQRQQAKGGGKNSVPNWVEPGPTSIQEKGRVDPTSAKEGTRV